MISDGVFYLIVNVLAFPFELFSDILSELNFIELFVGGIVIVLSTRFILRPIFGGSAFTNIGGSDSVKRRNNNYKGKSNNNLNRTKRGG